MQQSSRNPLPTSRFFGGCGRLLHALNPPRSAFLYLQCVIPTSYFIFNDFYIYRRMGFNRVLQFLRFNNFRLNCVLIIAFVLV